MSGRPGIEGGSADFSMKATIRSSASTCISHVRGEHLAVVHFIDVVAGQDQDVFRLVYAQDIQVLIDSVGRAFVPALLVDPLLRRQQLDELVELAAQETPAALDVLDQAVRLVLGDHADAADARVDAIGQREIDDAKLAAERHGRLGAPVGEMFQTATTATRQDQCYGVLRQQTDETRKFLDQDVLPLWKSI